MGVGNMHPAAAGWVDCFRRAVLPGDDGAVQDAHTFMSDAPVFAPAVAAADTHVPAVPREALALREAAYAAVGAPLTVHPDDTLRLHPPAAGERSAAAAAGLPEWPVAWPPAPSAGAPPLPITPRRASAQVQRPGTGPLPLPWATVAALFASAARQSLPPAPFPVSAGASPAAVDGDTLRLALPPRGILVLSRAADSARRLDDDSAAAAVAIFREVATERALSLATVALDSLSSLDEQVGAARRAGLVVGIHGANLVSAAFVPAGGALVEILPHGYRWPGWYEAGGNAGLRYSAVSSAKADRWPLPCVARRRRCNDDDVRDTTLVLDAPGRRQLRARLLRAVDYLDALWAACPDGWMTVRGDGAVYRLPDLAQVGKHPPGE